MTEREKRFFANIFKLNDRARDIANYAVKRLADDSSLGTVKATPEALSELAVGPVIGGPFLKKEFICQ
jgi:hypothetical protein